MKIYELILEDDKLMGVDAISIVESPAIEEQFIARSSRSSLRYRTRRNRS
jgi:hypothetical protein